jgi:transposase
MAWRSSYSAELRERELVAANGGLPAMAVADRFDFRLSFIYKVLKRWRLTGNATSRLQRNQQELELAAYHAAIRAEIERRPDVTLEEFCAAGWSRPLASRSLGLMHNTLIRVGLTPKRSRRAAMPGRATPQPHAREQDRPGSSPPAGTSSVTLLGDVGLIPAPAAPADRLGSALAQLVRADRLDVLRLGVPREEDPGVLADLGDEGVDHLAAGRLGVDGGEVRLGQELADDSTGLPGIDQIVDNQPALAVPLDRFQDLGVTPGLVVVGGNADRVDQSDVELAADDVRGHQTPAGDGDNALPGSA